MATHAHTTSARVGTGFLDPALCVKVLPASFGFPEFSIAGLKPAPNGSLLDTLARAWRREEMRSRMLMIDTDDDAVIDAIVGDRVARTALIEATMLQLRPETGRDVAALLDVALAIFEENDGAVCDEPVAERVRRLVFAARLASHNLALAERA